MTPPGTTLRNVRISEELWTAAQERAEREGTNVSEVMRELLQGWVDQP
jgi:predicted DNA binding CopG/RHH family protein